VGLIPLSFSSICRACGEYKEFHSDQRQKKCNDELKRKKANLDYYF